MKGLISTFCYRSANLYLYWCAAKMLAVGIGVSCSALAQTGSVEIVLNANGLHSLRYAGAEYLGYGDFRVNAVQLQTPTGQMTTESTSASTTSDSFRRELIKTFSWGSVRVGYSTVDNRLNLAITTTNTSNNTITGVFFEPFAIRFPSKPAEYDGNTPLLGHNVGEPTIIKMTYGANAVALTNDDVTKPLMVGFPFALDRPASMLLYPLRVNTGREPTYPNSLPAINRPIAPGKSDTYRISLRFGSAQTSLRSLAPDVYASFAALYPQRLSWPDRRAIGSLILATSAAGWPTNPRGWLLDPSIDVTSPSGVAAFRSRVLAWADRSVAILRNMNAQGMITWDIEGEQFPHATTYIGDPRLFTTLAPEMSGVADEYFKKFRDAGLRVGVCIRPQQLIVAPGGGNASQTEIADPTALLIDKISYAKSRWGATLFYVDSNGDPSVPLPVEVFARVAAAHPDVLLIPEHENMAYYSVTAPYNELRGGVASTPTTVREIYPAAFGIINTADGPIDQRYGDLRAAVSGGDSLMFRGWFDDAGNSKVKSLYPYQPDAVPPSVTFLAPGNNLQVSGVVLLQVSASDNVDVAGVSILVDGVQLGPELKAQPYSSLLDTRTLLNGSHTITAIARDSAGNQGSANITIFCGNPVGDSTPPAVSLNFPANGSSVSGYVRVEVIAADQNGIASAQLLIDGTAVGIGMNAPPFIWMIDTAKLTNGSHTFTAVAKDPTGNTGTSSAAININNAVTDTIKPTVNFITPADKVTITGPFSVTVAATDNVGVAGVQMYLDDQKVDSFLTKPPYSVQLNAQTLAPGTHVISATALDAAGNSSSTAISVTTYSRAPTIADSTPPSVTLVAPANNSTAAGILMLNATASDDVGVESVRYLVDGVIVAEVGVAPYIATLDTSLLPGGVHYLSAQARDIGGNVGTASASFSVGKSIPSDCMSGGIGAFLGCYFAGETFSDIRLARLDRELNFDWAAGSPDPTIPADAFSARWIGRFPFETGSYQFEMWLDDGARLYIDNELVLDVWNANSLSNYTVTRSLTAGTHTVRLEYREHDGSATAKLYWSRR